MASHIGDGDYLGAYRRFFVDFLEKVNPDDQLPIKTSGHDVPEGEIVGEIIYMTLQYLDQQLCPPSLQCYIVQLVIDEIKVTRRKQPEMCGFRQEEKTYAPLKLMQAVTGKVNEICQRYLDNSRLALLPPPPSTPMPLATAFAIRNNRRKMEDRHVVLHDLNTIFNIKDDSIASYYAVFDGHAGYHAAVFCAMHLHQYLAESHHYPTDPERALRDAFLTTDARFIEKSTGQTLSSGTTAVVAVILKRKLYIAWVGDSQAALAQRGDITQLVNPHKPDRNDERERVEEMGGTVMHRGIWRVNGNLAVSRAIGDAQYKPYVTGDPEIRCITLDGHEDFLIVACDGLWDCVTENEAAELVYRDLCRDPYNYGSSSQRLVEYAKNQGSIDNITVIVVFLSTPRQIISRSKYGNPLLADVQMNNMEPDNQYLLNANGQYEVNSAFVKQQSTANNGSADTSVDDEYGNYGNKSSNGKRHENGDKVADYDVEEDDEDLGPETDVDAVDDVSEPITTLSDVSRQLFADKADPSEIYRNDECMDDDYPSSPNSTKPHQRTVIPDTDNVGDSEDSEDEWNYYRIDPNKEEAGAAGFSPVPPKPENEVDDIIAPPSLEESEHTIDLQKKAESSKNSAGSNSDSESEREILTDVLADTEISAATTFELTAPKITDSEGDDEVEKVDEQEEKETRGEEEREEGEGATMDFQLNPDAAEFVPVSPTLSMPPRIDLDVPIAGSPLKQTPPMDDIKIPSRREFENEVRYRPHEIGEKSCANGRILENLDEASAFDKLTEDTSTLNLDESEVSSTKAEFGDESSFLITSELQRTGLSALDSSYTGSYGELDDSSVDPMTKSFGPSEFIALGDPVDLNAVHDLTDADLMAEGEESRQYCADETEQNNIKNAGMDTEIEESQTLIVTTTDNPTDNLLDYSPSVPVLHSPVNQASLFHSATPENEEILCDEHVLPSDLLQTVPNCSSDYSDVTQPILECQPSFVVAEVEAQADVTSRLLEMDLEDRGSQDCGFNKCNEQSLAHGNIKDTETENEEPTKRSSSLVSDENIADRLDQEDSHPVETTKIEESPNIENVTVLVDDFCTNAYMTSSQHSPTSQVPIMHNPLDLNVAAPSTIPHDNLILEDDSFRASSEVPRAPESPDVGLSPLVNVQSQNPFNQMEFANSLSSTNPPESDTPTIFVYEDDHKGFEHDNPLEHKSPLNKDNSSGDSSSSGDANRFEADTTGLDDKSLLEETIPLEEASPFEQKSPLEGTDTMKDTNVLEDVHLSEGKCVLDDASPLEVKGLLDDMQPLESKSLSEVENPSDGNGFFEDQSPLKGAGTFENKCPSGDDNPSDDKISLEVESLLVDEKSLDNNSSVKGKSSTENNIPLEHQKLSEPENTYPETEESAEISANLKLSESLQEFTGLEQQLNPEQVINGLMSHDNTIDAHNKDSEDKCMTMEMVKAVSDEILNKITELAVGTETKMLEEKTEMIEKGALIAASVAATVAAVGSGVTAKTSKAKPVGKVAPKTATATKTAVNKSTPTSPTKSGAAASARTSASAVAKKTSAGTSAPTRPNKLETVAKNGASSAPSTKSSVTTTSKTAGKPAKPAGRLSTAAAKTKTSTSAISSKSTAPGEKKPTSNGDAVKSSVSATTRVTSTSTRVSITNSGKPQVKSSTTSSGKASVSSTTATTTSANPRPKTATATNACKSMSKTTTASTGATGTTTQRPKTAPPPGAANLIAKSRLYTSTKSPTTEKQIKDTANKQISSSRTGATTTASKTSRASGHPSTLATTKRSTAAKSPSATANNATTPTIPPPIKKPTPTTRLTVSKTTTANGKVSTTKTTTTANKNKAVVENGVCTAEQDIEVVTCTTTMTTQTTNDTNEEDVPRKDISPVEPPTDNQLIVTAD